MIPQEGPLTSTHRLRPGLPGYLIPFATLAFAPQCQETVQEGAFATGIPPDIYAFHRYTGNSPSLSCPQVCQFRRRYGVKPRTLTIRLNRQPTRALRPVIPDNACHLRLTAAAGT